MIEGLLKPRFACISRAEVRTAGGPRWAVYCGQSWGNVWPHETIDVSGGFGFRANVLNPFAYAL